MEKTFTGDWQDGRRASKEYKYLTTPNENWIYLPMIRLMLKRIDEVKSWF
jgi:hypothetical protein